LFVPTGGFFASGTRFYSYNGQVIAIRTSSGGISWKLADHHGMTYATVDAANPAVSKRWQDPYGTNRGTPPSIWPDKHASSAAARTPPASLTSALATMTR
jgi:hypothetical protein